MTIETTIAAARAKAAELDKQVTDLNAQSADLAAQRDLHTKAAEALDSLDPTYKTALDALTVAAAPQLVQEGLQS